MDSPGDPNERTESEPIHASDGATKPMSTLAIFWFSLANIGYGMFYALNNAAIPLFLQAFTRDARLIGLMGSTHSFEGAILQPIVGSVSDRLRTRLGRRRPFMLIFVPLSVLFLILTPLARGLPVSERLGAIVACIFLFTVFFNIAQDPYQAMIADLAPAEQRGRVTSAYMLVGILGQAAIMLLPLPLNAKFGCVAAVMLATTLITCAATREPALPVETEKRGGHRSELAEAFAGLRILAQTRKAVFVLFFSGLGIGAVMPFLTIFIKTITSCTDQQAQQAFLILLAATMAGVIPFGWLADRIGPKRLLMLGLGLIALASLGGLGVRTLPQVALVMALAGLGNAAQSVSAYPLLTELVPLEEVGFYTGLQTTANSIATPLTAILTGWLINRGGYRVIFAVCAVCIAAGMAVLSAVRLRDAALEVAERNREQGRA
jgi:MFS family permease